MIDTVIPSDNNIGEKKHEKFGRYQGLKKELEKIWEIKATTVI